MNKRGFTLVELLGVIVILSIIMLIAIPNVTSVFEKSKRQKYLVDADTFITQVDYELSSGTIEKPTSSEILKIRLSYIGTSDVSKDSDGNYYDTENSYVIVVRKNGYLEYYVNLVTTVNDKNKGIRLANKDDLDSDTKLSLIQQDFTNPTNEEIIEKLEVSISSDSIIVY
jgi:prepilin-type N-terminal cleavage/methylation domain-containing protein